MNADIRNNRDFWAGVMLIATGVAALLIARDYPFGSAFRMGPGFFPSVLGGVLALFGLVLLVRGFRSDQQIVGGWSLRALVVLPLSFVLFGVLMDHAGFLPALAVLIFGSAAAGSEFKFKEVVLLTAVLTLLSVAIFIWGLGLPYPLLVGL
jgi:putative tricarboxylic transport membrane protein